MKYVTPKNSIEFKVRGRYALFTDPISKLGGEKFSYQIPTYEALKGICKSIYWKPAFVWVIDRLRIVKPIKTQSRGVKPIKLGGGNDLSIYTYLADVEYQVAAHFEWNAFRPELKKDQIDGKHFDIAKRALEKGGRQDIFLGTRDCQGYVEPCMFGSGPSFYSEIPELSYDLMFHSFGYPDEIGGDSFYSFHWRPCLRAGVIEFVPSNDSKLLKKFIRKMTPKVFESGKNFRDIEIEHKEQSK